MLLLSAGLDLARAGGSWGGGPCPLLSTAPTLTLFPLLPGAAVSLAAGSKWGVLTGWRSGEASPGLLRLWVFLWARLRVPAGPLSPAAPLSQAGTSLGPKRPLQLLAQPLGVRMSISSLVDWTSLVPPGGTSGQDLGQPASAGPRPLGVRVRFPGSATALVKEIFCTKASPNF